jgi:hypothetical protein
VSISSYLPFKNQCFAHIKKRTSRPPSFIGDSPITLRSRSSTCDSLKSGTSPTISINSTNSNRQISVGFGLGTSPKQQMSFPQYGGGASSPGSVGSRSTHSISSSQSRKSTASEFAQIFEIIINQLLPKLFISSRFISSICQETSTKCTRK